MSTIEIVPNNTLLLILHYIGRPADFLQLFLVCKSWRKRFDQKDTELWLELSVDYGIQLHSFEVKRTLRCTTDLRKVFFATYFKKQRELDEMHELMIIKAKALLQGQRDQPKKLEKLIRESIHDPRYLNLNYRCKTMEDNTLLNLTCRYCQFKSLKMLVERFSVDVNIPDMGGFTPLILCAYQGNFPAVLYLLSKGADRKAVGRLRSGPKLTAEHWAGIMGNMEIFRYLHALRRCKPVINGRVIEGPGSVIQLPEYRSTSDNTTFTANNSSSCTRARVTTSCNSVVNTDIVEETSLVFCGVNSSTSRITATTAFVDVIGSSFAGHGSCEYSARDMCPEGHAVNLFEWNISHGRLQAHDSHTDMEDISEEELTNESKELTTTGYNTNYVWKNYDQCDSSSGGSRGCSSSSNSNSSSSSSSSSSGFLHDSCSSSQTCTDMYGTTSDTAIGTIWQFASKPQLSAQIDSNSLISCPIIPNRPGSLYVAENNETEKIVKSHINETVNGNGIASAGVLTNDGQNEVLIGGLAESEATEVLVEETAVIQRFCYCRKGFAGQMIGCDGDACPVEWFHYECVGLHARPSGKWYCPSCSTQRDAALAVENEECMSSSCNEGYCICGRGFQGQMVGCDNSDCMVEWYHFECVQLTEEPKGKWECPACTGQKFEQPLISSVQSAVVVGTKRGCRARQTKRAKKECVR